MTARNGDGLNRSGKAGALGLKTRGSGTGHVESSAATVTMFHADEPGAKDAFDAAQVLAQYGGQAS